MTIERSGPKIGVLVPYTNCNLEPDMMALCPPGCTMHFARMGGYDINKIPGSSQMAGLGASDITEPLQLLSGVRPTVVLYGCTSATLTHGTAFDRDLAAKIRPETNAISLTAAGALVEGIKAIGATKVGFASPYIGEVNDQAVSFLADEDISVTRMADIGQDLGNYGQGELTPDDVFQLSLLADHPDAQAIVLSCTDMRSVEAIERIEAAVGKPVITSNQAMVFALMKALGIPRHKNLPGRLFSHL
ncbi:MAG: Asp/Glu racemase [Rhodospirillales bacterium]|jgi:maleate isomerase|nr:Asp/Glu racemase [Rhodospirillales bacterium]MBT4626618.1 Asp/Glu racemase [Rhodospirillales bacterium]MBT6109460.1 Asp/Glu racemase [Rhodospirillales bacterium]MBT6825138.1 Asp/Glu racemase [Rhodospirillales bacterium]MBT7778681.1 Asp/Glu racemase [Rhodospirillales bacterium]